MLTAFTMYKVLRVLAEETVVSSNLWRQGRLPGGGDICAGKAGQGGEAFWWVG